MKKTAKIIIALALTALTVISLGIPVFAENRNEVELRVEGISENIFHGSITVNQNGMTVLDFLKYADNLKNELNVSGLEYGYITEINGEKIAVTEKGNDGFFIRLNGERLAYTELVTEKVKNGDELLIYYSDEYERGMIFPIVNADRVTDGYMRFTYEKPMADGSGYTIESLAGATVRWYCEEAYMDYATDSYGGVRIESHMLTSGEHRVQISLADGDGMPLALRLEPDYTVEIPIDVGDTAEVYVYGGLVLISLGAAIGILVNLRKHRNRG